MAVALSVGVVACATATKTPKDSAAQREWEDLTARVERGEVERIEVLHIPSHIMTAWAVKPNEIEQGYHYGFTMRSVPREPNKSSVLQTMRSTQVEPHERFPDLRWAMIFHDAHGARVGAVYVDKFGKRGVVGSMPVALRGELLPWLKACFGSSYR
ncbi:MAG TPA: hypothetical protein VGQ83_34485 [Polyangia bacterium]